MTKHESLANVHAVSNLEVTFLKVLYSLNLLYRDYLPVA